MGAAIAVTEFIDPFGLGRYRVPQHDVAPVGDSGQKTLGNAPGLGAIFLTSRWMIPAARFVMRAVSVLVSISSRLSRRSWPAASRQR